MDRNLAMRQSRQSLKIQKKELIQEVEKQDAEQSYFTYLKVITQYLITDTQKNMRGFKIGIFTTFLVIMVITMLKSVVASAPLLFVKIGQDSVGAIDFQLESPADSNAMISGNVNYNSIDPFNNTFALVGREMDKLSRPNPNPPKRRGGKPKKTADDELNLLVDLMKEVIEGDKQP